MLRETRTENGRVRGVVGTDARITVYKGVPFAADTSGENRWRPPQPAEDWEGVRICSEFGPIPTQDIPGKDPDAFYSKEWHVDPEVPMGEDCLRANIWTPAKTASEKLPVLVWYFGRNGFSHMNSGTCALLFEAVGGGVEILSDSSWDACVQFAYGTASGKAPVFKNGG